MKLSSKDESPLKAIGPTGNQLIFLKIMMNESMEHAWSKGYTDFVFQGYSSYKYFCAYTSKVIRKGSGEYVYGFERKRKGLFFTFPGAVPDPQRMSQPWVQKPEVNRVQILIPEDASIVFWAYIVSIAKSSIDYAYSDKKRSRRYSVSSSHRIL